MKSRTSLFVFLLVFISLVLPSAAYAGGIPFFGPIIPQGDNQAVCPASWGMLIDVINNVISFVITISIVFIAPIMIAYAGFLYVINPMKPEGRSEANKLLKQVVVGIVVMLAAWLIVDAVMAVLYSPKDAGGTWSSLITSGGIAPCLEQRGALPNDTLNQAEINNVAVVQNNTVPDYLQENIIRGEFTNANLGITVNNNSCTATQMASNGGSLCGGTPPPCTNVSGMQDATIKQIIAIAKACGGNGCVRITGGTEPGHACGSGNPDDNKSHQNGFKVDLDLKSPALNSYIESMTPSGYRGKDRIYVDTCRNQYVHEIDHWDITVLSYCVQLK